MKNKKILIVGNNATSYALALKISENNEIYVTSNSNVFDGIAKNVDIRETNPKELLEFALENGIDITIPVAEKALNSDITSIFNANNQQIFGPAKSVAEIAIDKSNAKKLLYKLRIPTPKFGIFDKENSVIDYIKKQKTPFVLKTNESNSATILTSQDSGIKIASSCFIDKNAKLIIEDYVYGTPFSFYTITDGYKALPFGNSLIYKHSLEGNGGQLTTGMGACTPNYKLSFENEYFIMDNVIYPTLDYFEIGGNPYVGILGVNGIITDNNEIKILGYQPFLQDCDAANIINTIDEDILDLFEACIIGSFSDEFDNINYKDCTAVSLTLHSKMTDKKTDIISGIDEISENTIKTFFPNNINKNKYFEYETAAGAVMTLTALSSTPSGASKKVYDDLKEISFCGIKYRKDICKSI